MTFPLKCLSACLAVAFALGGSWGLCAGVGGAPDWIYRAWQTDEGLPDNSVTGIVQTPDGYLWVATRGGLLRFNGVKFTPALLAAQPGVSNRVVRAMCQDRQGRIWLGMERGQVMWLGPDGVRSYGIEDGLPNNPVISMVEDGAGVMWVAFSSGLARIRDGKCERLGAAEGFPRAGGGTQVVAGPDGRMWYARGKEVGFHKDGKLQAALTLSSEQVRICPSAQSGMWICAGSRLLRMREGREPEEVGKLPVALWPRVMFEDREGALWIGTATHGLFRFLDGIVEEIPTSHQEIECLLEDREGNLWVGTNGGGLDRIRPSAMVLSARKDGLSADSVRSVCEDSAGSIWVVLQNGRLARSGTGGWEEIHNSGSWSGGGTCIVADSSGSVWVGTRGRGIDQYTNGKRRNWSLPQGLAANSVRSLLAARDGSIWIATDSPRRLQRLRDGAIQTIRMPVGVTSLRSIRAMAEGADGTVWIGTAGGEVMRVKGEALVRESVISETHPNSVRALHATDDGTLWVGYAGGGLGRFNNGMYTTITSEMGLMDDYVSQILADGKGSLWIAGNHGLFKVGMAELAEVANGKIPRIRSRVFGRAEGLSGLQPSYDYAPSVCRGRDGRLWFAMRNGLLEVRPDKIRDNLKPPPVILERVSVDDRTVALYDLSLALIGESGAATAELRSHGKPLKLGPGHSKLDFEFAALSFSSPENVHFRYRLENFDRKWIETRGQEHASYSRLPAGKYKFRVIACNNAGVWNHVGAALSFEVAPFYWQTWWFRALAVALSTGAVIGLSRYLSFRRLRERMRVLKQEAVLHKERARIARDMHDEVGAKLTRLSLLSEMAGADAGLSTETGSDVREISETAREAILAFDEIVWAVNPRNDTLGDLVNYLCRHAEEFFEGSATHCVFDLPNTIPAVMLPTEVRHQVFLASKEALTNVLKHANASEVTVRLVLHPGAFELVIQDDGAGYDPALPDPRPGGGNGLPNMRERMRGIGGDFQSFSQPGQGTRILFKVPVG